MKMLKCFAVILFVPLALASPALDDGTSFKNYKVYDIQPSSRSQLEQLEQARDGMNLDFWSRPAIGRRSLVMVGPSDDELFKAHLLKHDIEHDLLHEDAQSAFDRGSVNSHKRVRQRRDTVSNKTKVSFEYLWDLDEIYNYLDYLAERYPDLVKLKSYGTTYENRTIKVITISKQGEINEFNQKPIMLIDGGMHAREWASHMSVVYLINQLVEHSEENNDLLENTNWVIMPVANPDGYVYTHTKNRLWRKNRAPTKNMLCNGVDLNRNFPFRWKNNGNECSSGYAGATPASELETRAVMLMMADYARLTKVYLAVHSCGDYILYPYGYDYVMAPNHEALQELGMQAAEAVLKVNGTTYQVGSASFLLYPANGSDDFIYGSYGVEYVFTLELSCGTGQSGFEISVAEMKQITKEAFEMFKVFGKFAGTKTVKPLIKNKPLVTNTTTTAQ